MLDILSYFSQSRHRACGKNGKGGNVANGQRLPIANGDTKLVGSFVRKGGFGAHVADGEIAPERATEKNAQKIKESLHLANFAVTKREDRGLRLSPMRSGCFHCGRPSQSPKCVFHGGVSCLSRGLAHA